MTVNQADSKQITKFRPNGCQTVVEALIFKQRQKFIKLLITLIMWQALISIMPMRIEYHF